MELKFPIGNPGSTPNPRVGHQEVRSLVTADDPMWDVSAMAFDPERFQAAAGQFQQAISAVEQQQIFNAMIHNGRAVSSALGDGVGRKTCNDMGILGCRVSSISGSGPAIALIIPSSQEATVRRVKQTLEPREWEILQTTFHTGEA